MRVFFKISGVVQGIGYRWFAVDAASKLGLTGFVRNRPDGSVEGEAQGDKAAVETFLLELKAGPPQAEVTNAETAPIKERKGEKDFVVSY